MLALINARIFTGNKGIIDKGVVIIRHGKIEKIGKKISVSKDIEIHDLKGRFITPGFIDAHCHVGIFNEGTGAPGFDGNDYSDPLTPHLKAIDGIYPDDVAFVDAINHGITTLAIAPGSANVVGGQIAVVKPVSNIIDEMKITDYAGMKCAFGENPKGVYGDRNVMPTTRMGVAALLRKVLTETINYSAKKDFHFSGKKKKEEHFEVDPKLECLIPVIRKEKPLRAHAHRADDIQTAIRIADEFNINIIIEHCTEGWKIADFLAKKGVSVILGPINTTKSKVELRDSNLASAKILEDAGVHFAIMTDAPVERIGSLFDDVRLSMRYGLSSETAIKSITINPAEILGLDDRLGSLEAGKDADLNIFDRDPFDFMAKIETVMINGQTVKGKLR